MKWFFFINSHFVVLLVVWGGLLIFVLLHLFVIFGDWFSPCSSAWSRTFDPPALTSQGMEGMCHNAQCIVLLLLLFLLFLVRGDRTHAF